MNRFFDYLEEGVPVRVAVSVDPVSTGMLAAAIFIAVAGALIIYSKIK